VRRRDLPRDSGAVERRALRIAAVAAVVLAAVIGAWAWRRARDAHAVTTGSRAPATASAPEGVRGRGQVGHSPSTRGLARRATQLLRDRGFDVVETGTATDQLDSTLVLDRSGHPDWARRVASALGAAHVEARPDSSRYLDVTVLLGRAWRPPTQ